MGLLKYNNMLLIINSFQHKDVEMGPVNVSGTMQL